MFINSIRWRLQIWYGAILLAVLAGFGFTSFQLERGRQFRRIDEELQRRVGALANVIRQPPGRERGPGERLLGRPPPRENLPPLEALALGCPVVLSDVPGVRTLFGESPVLVNPRSETSIADGIKWLHDNPDSRRERAAAGREIAIRNSPEQYVRNIQEIVDDFEPVRRCWP